MHSPSFSSEPSNAKGGDVLVSVATLVTEGRIPGNATTKSKKFYEGPHCTLIKGAATKGHQCDVADSLVRIISLFIHSLDIQCVRGFTSLILTGDSLSRNEQRRHVFLQQYFSIKKKQ